MCNLSVVNVLFIYNLCVVYLQPVCGPHIYKLYIDTMSFTGSLV